MVLPLLILGVILLAFSPQIASAVKNIISSKDPVAEKQQQMKELEKQATREDEGIFVTAGRILFGDKFRDEVVLGKPPKVPKPNTNTVRISSSGKISTDLPILTSKESGITLIPGIFPGTFVAKKRNEVVG